MFYADLAKMFNFANCFNLNDTFDLIGGKFYKLQLQTKYLQILGNFCSQNSALMSVVLG